MKNLKVSPKPVLKAGLVLISYFLLAACMQHDENLSPRDNHNSLKELASEVTGSQSAMTKNTFTAHLRSRDEVNPNGVISTGQGQAIFKISEDGTEISYKLIVANIENVTMAHIHCGEEGVNGPFIAWLFQMVPAPGVTVNGILAEGTITAADIISRPTCSGGFSTFEQLVERIRTGTAYVNVHTVKYGGGEIRGQIK